MKENWFIFVIILLSFAAILYKFREVMVGPYSFSNGFNAIVAYNYANDGFIQSKFAPVLFSFSPYLKLYYLSHPPLTFIYMGLVYIFAPSVIMLRLGVVAFTMFSIFLFYLFSKRITGKKVTAILAATFFGFSPMLLYYGKLFNFEAMVLCLMLAAILILISLKNKFKNWLYVFFILLLFVAALFDWPATFLFPMIVLYGLCYFKGKGRIKIILASFSLLFADVLYIFFTKRSFLV